MTKAEWQKHIGIQIMLRRRELGLSQPKLAGTAGMSTTALNRLERGHQDTPSYNLYRVAGALGCSLDELIGQDHISQAA